MELITKALELDEKCEGLEALKEENTELKQRCAELTNYCSEIELRNEK